MSSTIPFCCGPVDFFPGKDLCTVAGVLFKYILCSTGALVHLIRTGRTDKRRQAHTHKLCGSRNPKASALLTDAWIYPRDSHSAHLLSKETVGLVIP